MTVQSLVVTSNAPNSWSKLPLDVVMACTEPRAISRGQAVRTRVAWTHSGCYMGSGQGLTLEVMLASTEPRPSRRASTSSLATSRGPTALVLKTLPAAAHTQP